MANLRIADLDRNGGDGTDLHLQTITRQPVSSGGPQLYSVRLQLGMIGLAPMRPCDGAFTVPWFRYSPTFPWCLPSVLPRDLWYFRPAHELSLPDKHGPQPRTRTEKLLFLRQADVPILLVGDTRSRIRTERLVFLKHAHVPILLIEHGAQWGIRTRNQRVLSAPSLPIGLIGRQSDEIPRRCGGTL